jgi:hypothetical protein
VIIGYYAKATDCSNFEVWISIENQQHQSSCLMIDLGKLGLQG